MLLYEVGGDVVLQLGPALHRPEAEQVERLLLYGARDAERLQAVRVYVRVEGVADVCNGSSEK